MTNRTDDADEGEGHRGRARGQENQEEKEKRGNERVVKPKTLREILREMGADDLDPRTVRMVNQGSEDEFDGTQDDHKLELDTAQEILTYAETLHKGLKLMWLPMVFLGRMPFRLLLKKNQATISVKKRSPAYIACLVTCVLTWLLFLWITFGLLILISQGNESSRQKLSKTFSVSVLLSKRFWRDTFILWTTLLQAAVSTTHILQQAEEFALFIKAWYHVLDLTQIEVSRTLKQYIVINQVMLLIFLIATIVMYFIPDTFPHTQGTGLVVVIALGQPFIHIGNLSDEATMSAEDGTFYFQMAACVGLIVYIIAILFSWLYVMQFMVFCRCFRKGLECINERIAMILEVDDVKSEGPNALRLSYEEIHKDYLGIATTGIKIGKIFSWTICNYYLWAVLVLVVELGEIFKFAKKDYRNEVGDNQTTTLEAAGFPKLTPVQVVTNDLLHFIITAVLIFYIAHEGSRAYRLGKMSYELARYRGLVECTSTLERNFIRSIWIIVSEKCPVHVSPGKFFGITHHTTLTVFATALTYFIFWVQSQGQIASATGGGADETDGNTTSSPGSGSSGDFNNAGKLFLRPPSNGTGNDSVLLPYS